MKIKKKLTEKEVLHIAKLANLSLDPEEVALFSLQLSETLSYVAQLQAIDTKKVKPTFQTTGLTNVVREDEIKPSLTQEQALANAPKTYRGYFKVKSIFKPII